MDVFMFIIVSFCIGHCYGQNARFKLARLQQDVEYLRDLALDLIFDIQDLQEWRNVTIASPSNAGAIDTDNEVVEDSRLLRSFEQSLNAMEGRVSYIIKGLEGEKMTLREMMADFRVEVQNEMAKIKISVNSAVTEINDTRVIAANNKDALRDVFSNVTSRLEMVDAHIAAEMDKGETKCKEENRNLEEAIRKIDAKLNQQILTKESRDAEINEQINRLSNQLELSKNNHGDALGQLKDLSKRFDTATKVNGDIREQVNFLSKLLDTTAIMKLAKLKQDGWLQYNNHLYKRFTSKVTFTAAVKSCEKQDAFVVEVTDARELRFLVDKIGSGLFWLGATDRQDEGEWRWLSGRLVKYANWAPGQPNGSWWDEEGCILTVGDNHLQYHVYPCTSRFWFVCERPIPS